MKTLILICILITSSVCLYFVAPKNPTQIEAFKKQLIENATSQMVAKIPPPKTPGLLCLLPLAGDQEYVVSQVLSSKIDDSGKFKCIDLQKLISRNFNYANLSDAIKIGKEFHADFVAYGKVVQLSQKKEKSELTIQFSIVTLQNKKFLWHKKILSGHLQREVSLKYFRAWIFSLPFAYKLFCWLITLLFPFIFYKPVTKALDKESNMANFVLLIVFVTISTICVFALMGFQLTGIANSIFMSFAFIGGIAIHYFILSWIEELRK